MLRLYNTLSREIEDFKAINPPNVGMYTCGPTVYRDIHIGNFRTYLMSDFLRRVLEYNGYRVKKVQNITDVGHMRRDETNPEAFDPVIKAALESGKTPLEITQTYTKQFLNDSKRLNIIDADVYPKASDNIKEIIVIVKDLLSKGFAYDTGKNIYFDVKKFKNYGELSGNTLQKMEKLLKAVRVASETDKTESADFVLWKRVDPDYLMKWESPWGLGTPGWHIECSAMSIKYLGNGERNRTIDIHTGGEDNIFPHHEDEIAQSEAWTGEKFVSYWLHGGHLTVDGEKMARRKDNVYLVQDLVNKGFDPLAFRYLTMTSYYRAKMNFTWEALEAAQTAFNRLKEEVAKWDKPKIGCAEYEQKFLNAINDDLNLPKALGIVWELVKSDYPTSAKAESLFKMDKVLGLDLSVGRESRSKNPFGQAQGRQELRIPKEIGDLIRKRESLRKEERYDEADKIRERLNKLGYEIKDTESGAVVNKITK